MEDFDIEKMAREYAEMLRSRERVKTSAIEVPSEKRDAFFKRRSTALSATEYLLSCVNIPWKKRVLLSLRKQLCRIRPLSESLEKRRYSSPEQALTSLLYAALDMAESTDSFDPPEEYLSVSSRLLPLISFLFV